MRQFMKEYVWPVLWLVVALTIFIGALFFSTPFARADYNAGCERVGWGFLMSGYRTICDGPKRADGSWDRTRREWTPEHYVPSYCYRWSCSGGYWVGESTQRFETYPVNDTPGAPNNHLENEPGWLPPGTLLIH